MKTGRILSITRMWLLSLVAVVQLLFVAGVGIADDGPIWLMGGSASPKSSHSTIRMDSEEVTIRLHRESYIVDAVFHFFNTGETTTEWVGFPKRGMGYSDSFTGTRDFIRFETWVGDREVDFIEEQDLFSKVRKYLGGKFFLTVEDFRWMVKRVQFPGHCVTTTRVKYEAHYERFDGGKVAYYIYGTGGYWKDSIGKATFAIDASALGGTAGLKVNVSDESQPLISRDVLTYELRDFKPRPDAKVDIFFEGP